MSIVFSDEPVGKLVQRVGEILNLLQQPLMLQSSAFPT